MTADLVLTVLGEDRPGLVDTLSGVISSHDGNWLESRMARLAGQFAGLLRVSAPDEQLNSLRIALTDLSKHGLQVTIELAQDSTTSPAFHPLSLELTGQDRPGIVHDISHALASLAINVEELSTWVESASMAGGELFRAEARLQIPETVSEAALRELLEGLADQLMVDIHLEAPPS